MSSNVFPSTATSSHSQPTFTSRALTTPKSEFLQFSSQQPHSHSHRRLRTSNSPSHWRPSLESMKYGNFVLYPSRTSETPSKNAWPEPSLTNNIDPRVPLEPGCLVVPFTIGMSTYLAVPSPIVPEYAERFLALTEWQPLQETITPEDHINLAPQASVTGEDSHRSSLKMKAPPAAFNAVLEPGGFVVRCTMVHVKSQAENAERFQPSTEWKPGQEPMRLKDHIRKEAHIDVASHSVAIPTGKERQDFFGTTARDFEGEEQMRAAFLKDPSSFKGKAVLNMEEGPIGGPGMLEMLTQKNTIMGAGLRQENSPGSSVRGMRPQTASSKHKRRRTGYDSESMVDEILKNDQEASIAFCPCLKEVHGPSRCCCVCSEVLHVQLVGSSCQCSKQGRDLSGCCGCSKVVCDPPVGSSCRCSNMRLSECCCQCSNVVCDSPVGFSCQGSNVRNPSGCRRQCYKVVRDAPAGSSCRCLVEVRDAPVGSCRCSKEVNGPCTASNEKLELTCKDMQKKLFIFCVISFMWMMIISFLSPPEYRYCY